MVDRERGTNSLPFSPRLVLALAWCASTVITSILFYDNDDNYNELSKIVCMIALGSFVTIYGGIVKGIPTFTQWMGMLLVGVWSWTVQQQEEVINWTVVAITVGYIIGMTMILNKLIPSFVCQWIGQLATLPRLLAIVTVTLSLLIIIMNSGGDVLLSSSLMMNPLWIPMLLCIAYYRNWSHAPHGSLYASTAQYGQHVLSMFLFMAVIVNLTIVSLLPVTPQLLWAMEIIMGSCCVTLTLAVFFAAVGDVWYAVGTGQFQMISVDTAGIVFYFFCPMYILLCRLCHQCDITITVSNTAAIGGGNGKSSSSSLVVLSYAALVSISLLQLYCLCPLAGYIHANVYLHGQPNRKQIALSLHYQSNHFDYYYPTTATETTMTGTTPTLNILLTLQDLIQLSSLEETKKQTTIQQQLQKHEYALCQCRSKDELKKAIELYTQLFKKSPSWYHATSCCDSTIPNNNNNNNIDIFREATIKYNMRVAYWSVQLSSSSFTTGTTTPKIGDGNFVYWNNNETMPPTLEQIQSTIQDKIKTTSYKMETLSTVAQPLMPMTIS